MKGKVVPLFSRQTASPQQIWIASLAVGIAVLAITLLLQWVIYDDWMQWKGPLRVVGSVLAGTLASVLVAHSQYVRQRRTIELLRRFETIAKMNDQIRNALQIIQCVNYAANSQMTWPVESAVQAIDRALEEVLTGTDGGIPPSPSELGITTNERLTSIQFPYKLQFRSSLNCTRYSKSKMEN